MVYGAYTNVLFTLLHSLGNDTQSVLISTDRTGTNHDEQLFRTDSTQMFQHQKYKQIKEIRLLINQPAVLSCDCMETAGTMSKIYGKYKYDILLNQHFLSAIHSISQAKTTLFTEPCIIICAR